MGELYDMIKAIATDKNAQPAAYHWDLVREYFMLSGGVYYPEHMTTYMQAVFDCVGMLVKLDRLEQS